MRVEGPAFVLRTYPLGESDRIVVLFSADEGKLRGVAPRAAASRRRFGGALSVLCEVEVAYQEKEGRDLGRLESCHLLAATPGEGRDLEAFYACTYLAEILDQVGREREADPTLYRLTRACTGALAAGIEPVLVARYFEVWTLRLAGVLPALELCARCGRDPGAGGAVLLPGEALACRRCGHGAAGAVGLDGAALALLRAMLTLAPAALAQQEMTPAAQAAVGRVAAAQFLHLVERPFRTAAAVVPRRPVAAGPVGGGRRR
jgi:DNA repair protein RecO (recombination protein O)